jgi:RNA polymerase sigma-70 factor (ECF subfamily)
MTLPDDEIVARVASGERSLFEVIMRRYNQRLFRVARSVVRDDHEAEDVVQQAYLSAYAHLGQPMSDSEPLRNPEDEASRREMSKMLEEAIDELPDIYRIVFVMRELEQMSTTETASALQIGEEATKVRLHRAKGLLRQAITARMQSSFADAFPFLGPRCDRIVSAVMSAIAGTGPR